jgi:hypothetical protein
MGDNESDGSRDDWEPIEGEVVKLLIFKGRAEFFCRYGIIIFRESSLKSHICCRALTII